MQTKRSIALSSYFYSVPMKEEERKKIRSMNVGAMYVVTVNCGST